MFETVNVQILGRLHIPITYRMQKFQKRKNALIGKSQDYIE